MKTEVVNVGETDKNSNSYDSEIWKELGLWIYKKHVYEYIYSSMNIY